MKTRSTELCSLLLFASTLWVVLAAGAESLSPESLKGSWVSLNQAAIDRDSMRARDFAITRFSPDPEGGIQIEKQSFILAGNGEYLIFSDYLEGKLSHAHGIDYLDAGDARWTIQMERRGINADGSFSIIQLELMPVTQSRTQRPVFLRETFFRVPAPNSHLLEGDWLLAAAAEDSSGEGKALLTILEESVFVASGLGARKISSGNTTVPSRNAPERGFWDLTGDQLLLTFQEPPVQPDKASTVLTLHFLGFNGQQMRLLDQRGYIWKLQRQ